MSRGVCPPAFEEKCENNCSKKKFRLKTFFFPAFLENLVTYSKLARDLCVAADATYNFKGGLRCMPPSPPAFEKNLEKNVKWINCI